MIVWTVIAKAALISGILVGAGLILARASLGATDQEYSSSRLGMQRMALGAAALGAIASVVILIVRLGGGLDAGVASIVLQSPSGIAAVVLLLGAFLGVLHLRTMYAGALFVVIASGIAGHASANSFTSGMIVALHVAAASWWTGSLLLLLASQRESGITSFANLLVRFSRQARWMIVVLLAAGVWAIYDLIGFSLSSLSSTYGKVLLLKLCLVTALLCVALYNRRTIAPAMKHDMSRASDRLRKTILGELAVISLVIAATAILTTVLSPPQPGTMMSQLSLRTSLAESHV